METPANIKLISPNRVEIDMQTAQTAKRVMIQLLEEQPEDSSYDELLQELAFHRMVERGLADSEAGRTISHEEMGRRIKKWSS